MSLFIDRVFRLPRVWSNRELKKHAHLFSGDIVNVSAWKDFDKESQTYQSYFTNADSYTITNYATEKHGYQGAKGELFLDLESPLDTQLHQKFDVVFNHTTLEHIFEVNIAFENLCLLSKDIVIIVLPFLQQYHSNMGDYWRFTPLAIKRLFEKHEFTLIYQSFNSDSLASVYTYSIATRHPEKWRDQFPFKFSVVDPLSTSPQPFVGSRAFLNLRHRFRTAIKKVLKV